jgi:hypothetical protein
LAAAAPRVRSPSPTRSSDNEAIEQMLGKFRRETLDNS